MVGQRFCERLVEFDTERRYRIVTFCEEPRAAYDRVGLTSFFAHRDAEKLMLARHDWYASTASSCTSAIGRARSTASERIVRSDKGVEIAYDHVVLATGSFPFVPPVPGIDKPGVFVYRTIEDLQQIIAYAGKSRAVRRDRRRAARARSGEGGLRPGARNARRSSSRRG